MSNTNSSTTCLHVPALICEQTTTLCWQEVDGAAEYRLEACFDALIGDGLSAGESWVSIDGRDETWLQIDTYQVDWQTVENAPESHTAYRGAGTVIRNPDAGLTWMQIKNLSEMWSALNASALTWDEIEELYPGSLVWDSLDAMHRDFDSIDSANMTWDELETEEPHTGTHLSCVVDIPVYTGYAIFRIRVFDQSGGEQCTLQTARIPVTTSQKVEILPLKETAAVQIEGAQADPESDVKYRLQYDRKLLDVSLQSTKRHLDPESTEELWSGVTATGEVQSKTESASDLRFDWQQIF